MFFTMLLQALMSGMLEGEHFYVVRGAVLKCSEGSDPGVLNLPTSHGVYIKDQPVLHVMDAVPIDNISHFGFCKKTGGVCEPLTCGPWTDGKKDVLIDEQPALLSQSQLMCTTGGTITIDQDGQL